MKILLTDLDGTLLNKESIVSEYTKKILTKWVAAGNLLVPSSGRAYSSILEVVEKAGILDLVTYVSAYNGAVIWNRLTASPIWEAKLPEYRARFIEKKAKEHGIHAHTYYNEQIISPAKDKELEIYTRWIHMPVVINPAPMDYVNSSVYKYIAINIDDHQLLCNLRDEIVSDDLNVLFSNPYYLEIFNRNAGKGNALKQLCQLLDINPSDSYAAGDEENDISMLQAAGCGIAMLNATDNVKSHSNVITDYDNGQDGLAHYIEDYLLCK